MVRMGESIWFNWAKVNMHASMFPAIFAMGTTFVTSCLLSTSKVGSTSKERLLHVKVNGSWSREATLLLLFFIISLLHECRFLQERICYSRIVELTLERLNYPGEETKLLKFFPFVKITEKRYWCTIHYKCLEVS